MKKMRFSEEQDGDDPPRADQRPVLEVVELRIVVPAICSTDEISTFCGLVCQGEEVQREGLESRVKMAKALVFLRANDDLVGVAGLKLPAQSYRDRVFRSAGVCSAAPTFAFELRWVFVSEAHRGRGYAMVLSAPRVRLKIGDTIYEATVALMTDRDDVAGVMGRDPVTVERGPDGREHVMSIMHYWRVFQRNVPDYSADSQGVAF